MRMAKVQKATLDPTKISGRCGRLMCCLRYEDQTYEKLRRTLPKKNVWVRTETITGKVIGTQIITQLVRLALPDGSIAAVANEEIVERNLTPPASKEEAAQLAAENAANLRTAKEQLDQALENVSVSPEAKAETAQDDSDPGKESGKKRSRKRRRRKRKSGGSEKDSKAGSSRKQSKGDGKSQSSAGQKSSKGSGSSGSQGSSQKKRRRPRRRRKKPTGQGNSGSSKPSSGS
jgi:uncharacterized membrane protein YgcG